MSNGEPTELSNEQEMRDTLEDIANAKRGIPQGTRERSLPGNGPALRTHAHCVGCGGALDDDNLCPICEPND